MYAHEANGIQKREEKQLRVEAAAPIDKIYWPAE